MGGERAGLLLQYPDPEMPTTQRKIQESLHQPQPQQQPLPPPLEVSYWVRRVMLLMVVQPKMKGCVDEDG